MARCIEIEQNNIEGFFAEQESWDAEYLQLSPGRLNFATTYVELPGMQLWWNRFGSRMRLLEEYNGRWLLFGCVLDGSAPPVYRGDEFPHDYGFIYQPGIEHDLLLPKHCRSLMIYVSPSLVDLMGWKVDPAPARRVAGRILCALADECQRATRRIGATVRVGGENADDLLLRDRILARLDAALSPWLARSNDVKPGPLAIPGAFRIVKDTEKLFSQHGLEDTSVDSLARELGISRRTLFWAFRKHLGMGPHRYLQVVRLHRLRERLLAKTDADTTIAREAADLGFNHFGRLSAAYRALFSELPSETRKRAARPRG